jgi:hypothetical protein
VAERAKHIFEFQANVIGAAAEGEALYHRARARYWREELEKATFRVSETAGVRVERVEHTGGWSPQVVVNYGDPAAYARMTESARKIQEHDKAAERFESDRVLYNTQAQRIYPLDGEDVAHFRLNGRAREE